MKISEAQKQFGEPLAAIESLSDCHHAHYLRIEDAVEHATLEEIQSYYARLHGMSVCDAVADPRFPWHQLYRYGDAGKCCSSCQELEMAIACNITSVDLPLAKWFPELASARNPTSAPEKMGQHVQ